MALLSDHVNVYSSCIALLDLQGWKIEIEPCPYHDEDCILETLVAVRDGTTIRADDPLRLLGLATIDEYHKPHGDESYWWRIKSTSPNLYEKLKDDALERSFFTFKEDYPDDCYQIIQQAIKDSISDPSTQPHDRLGISLDSLHAILKENPELKNIK